MGPPKSTNPRADKATVVSMLQRNREVRSKHFRRGTSTNIYANSNFRYNVRPMHDTKRMDLVLKKSEGKRLMLEGPKNVG